MTATIPKTLTDLPPISWIPTPDDPALVKYGEDYRAWKSQDDKFNELTADLAELSRQLAGLAAELMQERKAQARTDWQVWRCGEALPKSALPAIAQRFERLTAINDLIGQEHLQANADCNRAAVTVLGSRAGVCERLCGLWNAAFLQRAGAAFALPGLDNAELKPKSAYIDRLMTLRDQLHQAARWLEEHLNSPYTGIPLESAWAQVFPSKSKPEAADADRVE
jgi:hypothetical protein